MVFFGGGGFRTFICLVLVVVVVSVSVPNCGAFTSPSVFQDRQKKNILQQEQQKQQHSPSGLRHQASSSSSSSFSRSQVYFASVASGGGGGGGGEGVSGDGKASIPNEIFNLVKNIVGAGVLSLPAGIAAFGNAPSALIPAMILITIIGGISGYGFSLIGRVCSYTGANSYRDAWAKTVGESTSWLPAAACTFKTSAAVLAYSMILSDTGRALFHTAGLVKATRTQSLLGITTLILLPLCLLKNLSSLAPFSLLGVAGMIYTAVAMGIRYLSGSYIPPNGKFVSDIVSEMKPAFGLKGAKAVFDPSAFILVCMLSTAYMAHFNAPKFYKELKNNTIPRFNAVVSSSFAISVALFSAVASLGFLTFGSSCSGLILNNYSTKDALMSFSRIAVAISIVFSYPLAFVGVRDGVLDLANIPLEKRTNQFLNKLTLGLLSIITFTALQIQDLSFVLAFGGATLGNALIYVFPALMYRKSIQKMGSNASLGQKREVIVAWMTAIMGVIMGVIGAKMSLQSILS